MPEQDHAMPEQDHANTPYGPDVTPLLPRLNAQTLAQFDAMTGLLVVNVSQAEFLDAFLRWARREQSDNQLIAAINHETYHYYQTISAGFPFHHMTEMVRTIAEHLRGVEAGFW